MNSGMVDVDQVSYTSHPDISTSDHKPVSANFDVRVRYRCLSCSAFLTITCTKVAALTGPEFETLVQDLWGDVGSTTESQEVPRLRVNTTFIDFGSFT